MRTDSKIAVAVREDLAVWQKLNVTAFLASGVAGLGDLVGAPYEDGSGNAYLPLFSQPVLVYAATAEALGRARERALTRGLAVAVYTEDMFKTSDDESNRAVVQAVAADELNLVGLAVYGRRGGVDAALRGLPLHP